MTRFFITLDQSVKFVVDSFKRMRGGEIFIPKLSSVKIIDIVKALTSKPKINIIGIRQEKNYMRLWEDRRRLGIL